MDTENMLRIGDVASIFNISRETLRFFEQKGLVVPHKSPRNRYRYYSYWDINFLIEYIRYRSYEFSLLETRDIMYSDSLEELEKHVVHNCKRLEEKIGHYQRLLKRNKLYLSRLRGVSKRVAKYTITDMPKTYYFPIRNNTKFIQSDEVSKLISEWLRFFPFINFMFVVNTQNAREYECGLGLRCDEEPDIPVPITPLVKEIQASKAVNTVVLAGERNTFSPDLLAGAYSYIKKKGYTPNGPATGYYLARVHEPEGYRRYLDVFIPVRTK